MPPGHSGAALEVARRLADSDHFVPRWDDAPFQAMFAAHPAAALACLPWLHRACAPVSVDAERYVDGVVRGEAFPATLAHVELAEQLLRLLPEAAFEDASLAADLLLLDRIPSLDADLARALLRVALALPSRPEQQWERRELWESWERVCDDGRVDPTAWLHAVMHHRGRVRAVGPSARHRYELLRSRAVLALDVAGEGPGEGEGVRRSSLSLVWARKVALN